MIGRLLRGGFMTAIYAYLYIPIIILIVNSFNSSRFGINWQGLTTKWYSLLMNNDSLLQAAQHSLTMAVFSATFCCPRRITPWRSRRRARCRMRFTIYA